ncbi:hypothetical protein [Halalkalibacter oceani]|uniref:hypothetical protein n=1 Tax=Halalkalibacter oceani TaxID=1653776 RepID=UPI003398BDAB
MRKLADDAEFTVVDGLCQSLMLRLVYWDDGSFQEITGVNGWMRRELSFSCIHLGIKKISMTAE